MRVQYTRVLCARVDQLTQVRRQSLQSAFATAASGAFMIVVHRRLRVVEKPGHHRERLFNATMLVEVV